MIEYIEKVKEKGIKSKITQKIFPPSIYLDTWAIFDFSLINQLSKKFINIVNNLNATLILSIITVFETMSIKDQNQINSVLNFLDSINIANTAFLDFNFVRVIKRENDFRKKDIFELSPALDDELLSNFIPIFHNSKKVSVSDIFIAYRKEFLKVKKINENWEKELFPKIIKARKNIKIVEKAKTQYSKRTEESDHYAFPYTKFLFQQLYNYLVINKNMNMPDKEWIDIFHLVVPVAYCDFVLMDKRWFNFFDNLGLSYPKISRIYFKRKLSQFFNDLKNWGSHN